MPTLSVDSFWETGFHLPAIRCFRQGARTPSGVQRDYCGAYAQFLTTKAMVMLAIVSGIGQDAIKVDPLGGLRYRGRELRRIVARSPCDPRAREKVRTCVTHGRELRPSTPPKGPIALAVNVVGTGVTGFQARSIHSALRALVYEVRDVGAHKDGAKQGVESLFFSNRFSA